MKKLLLTAALIMGATTSFAFDSKSTESELRIELHEAQVVYQLRQTYLEAKSEWENAQSEFKSEWYNVGPKERTPNGSMSNIISIITELLENEVPQYSFEITRTATTGGATGARIYLDVPSAPNSTGHTQIDVRLSNEGWSVGYPRNWPDSLDPEPLRNAILNIAIEENLRSHGEFANFFRSYGTLEVN